MWKRRSQNVINQTDKEWDMSVKDLTMSYRLKRLAISSPDEADADEKEALKTWLLDVLLGTEAKVPPQLSRA